MKENDKDDRKKITVFVDPDVHTAAAVKLAQQGGKPAGFSFQSVLEQLLADWAGGKREVESRPEPSLGPDRYREDLERLVEVLQYGSPSERDLLRSTIRHHAEALRDRSAKAAVTPNPLRSSRSAKDQHRPAR